MTNTFLTRREFLAANVVAATAMFATSSRAAGISELYAGLKSDDFFTGPLKEEANVVDQKVFTEGPAVAPDGRVFFTNASAAKILIWNPKTRELSTFRENSGEANGLLFDQSGRLLACEGKSGRVTRTDMNNGEIKVLVDRFNGHPLGAPNDLTIDAKGRIYFTSRLPNDDPKQHNVNSVYRVDPDGKVTRVLHEPDIHMPNGVEVSPDGRTLYLIESDGRANRNRCIFACDLKDDGTVTNARRITDFSPGRGGDGLCVDAEGNLYVAAGLHKTRGTSEALDTKPGIHVISPSGKLLAYLGYADRHAHELHVRRRGPPDALHHLRRLAAERPHKTLRAEAPTMIAHRRLVMTVTLLWLSIATLLVRADEPKIAWKQTGTLSAPEAHQAAAADEQCVYAITNTLVAKYDRQSGARLATSTGEAKHLNSGFLWERRLYCAHSNYPQMPERSEIKVLDLETMRLTTFKDFGNFGGSLTWAVRHEEHWWCNFARYGDDNAQTFLVKFNHDWREQGRWTYPDEVIRELGRMSLSGGLWRNGTLLVTGHDDPVLFQLRLPKTGNVLKFVGKQPAPFTGQGIAIDPKTGGLVGIDRSKKRVVFASDSR